MKILRNNLWADVISGRSENRARNNTMILKGKRGKIFCTYLMAAGKGKHPAIIFCHGYPGNEENMDMAHAFRRIGFHVMNFHYSGSWGSDGDFSLTHCIEDTESVLNLLLSDLSLEADPDHLFIFGQSMGGFIAYHMLTKHPEIKAGILAMPCDFGFLAELSKQSEEIKQMTLDLLEDGVDWLQGTDRASLYKECLAFAEDRTFEMLADKITKKSLLVFSGTLDTLCPPSLLIEPWVNAIKDAQSRNAIRPSERIRYHEINTDHMFADARCTVTEITADFLSELCNE